MKVILAIIMAAIWCVGVPLALTYGVYKFNLPAWPILLAWTLGVGILAFFLPVPRRKK